MLLHVDVVIVVVIVSHVVLCLCLRRIILWQSYIKRVITTWIDPNNDIDLFYDIDLTTEWLPHHASLVSEILFSSMYLAQNNVFINKSSDRYDYTPIMINYWECYR